MKKLVGKINEENPDVVMILGDHCHGDRGLLRKLFELYSGIYATRILCMGNHDYWVSKNQFDHHIDSLSQREYFNKLCKESKFHSLESGELYIDDYAFVGGSMWYDYSFRPEAFSEDSCIQKRFTYMDGNIPRATMWMDSEYVRMPYSDKEFCEMELAILETQLQNAFKRGKNIISGTHFLPFKECVASIGKPEWDYFNAFMGSEKIGELFSKYGAQHAFFGHSHSDEVEIRRNFDINGIKLHNVAYSKQLPFTTLVINDAKTSIQGKSKG